MVAILVAAVVLAVAFGSVVAMGLPIGVALVAILVGSSALGVLAGLTAVPKIATVIGLMLALGVGIDYALLILTRHRQNLATGMSVPQAAAKPTPPPGSRSCSRVPRSSWPSSVCRCPASRCWR